MKYRMLIAAIAVAIAAAMTVQAEETTQPGKGHRPEHRDHKPIEGLLPPLVVEKLKLTDDQKTQFDAIVADFGKEAKAFWKSHQDLREKMKAAHDAKDEAKMKELREALKPLMELRHEHMEKVLGLLTDEQKAELKKMHEKFQEKREHHDKGSCKSGKDAPKPQE